MFSDRLRDICVIATKESIFLRWGIVVDECQQVKLDKEIGPVFPTWHNLRPIMQKFTIARSPLQSNGLLSLRNIGIIVHNILVEEKGKGKEKQIFEIKKYGNRRKSPWGIKPATVSFPTNFRMRTL